MTWKRMKEPGERSRTCDNSLGLELLEGGGGPGYSEFFIVRADDHSDVLCHFGAGKERRSLTEEEKRENPFAEMCAFYRLDRPQKKRFPIRGYTIDESKQIVREAILAMWISTFSPEAIKKYKLDVVFDF